MRNLSSLEKFANPTYFMQLSQRLLPWCAGASAAFILYGMFQVFFVAPSDYQQGETVKIMYIHVPAAWLGMMGYALIALSSFGYLVFRHPLADVSAKSAAPLGATFTFLALATGSLWGKPMWGTYWVWDARLTSMLLLLLLYFGLMALRSAFADEALAAKLCSVLGLVGVTLLPIIKFSVDWWNTLHQPASVFRVGGPTIHKDLLIPLLYTALGFTLLFMVLHLKSMQNEILKRRLRALTLADVEEKDRLPSAMRTE